MPEQKITSPTRQPARLSRRRKTCFALVSVIFALALALGAAEIFVRLIAPQPIVGIMYSGDSTFGFWNRADLNGKSFQSEAERPPYTITTDRNGYRVHPRADPRPAPERFATRRIVLLGDSFVFGVGVEDSQTLPARLEAALNDRAARESLPVHYQVVNAGCPGWGTENALAFWTHRGGELAADLLVVAFYRNDLEDNTREMVYHIEHGRAVYAPTRQLGIIKNIARSIPFYEFLAERSHSLNLVRRAAALRLTRPSSDAASHKARERGLDTEKTSALIGDAVATTATVADRRYAESREAELRSRLAFFHILMESLFDEARALDTPTALLLLPGLYDCVPQPLPDYASVAALGHSWLKGDALEMLIDPLEEMVAAWQGGFEVFLPADGHYTAQGNDLVAGYAAAAIFEWFISQEAPPEDQPPAAGEPASQRFSG